MKAVLVKVGFIAVDVVISALLMAFPVYLLWNWLMPEIFGLATLTFLEALGVSMLAECLFGRSSSNSNS